MVHESGRTCPCGHKLQIRGDFPAGIEDLAWGTWPSGSPACPSCVGKPGFSGTPPVGAASMIASLQRVIGDLRQERDAARRAVVKAVGYHADGMISIGAESGIEFYRDALIANGVERAYVSTGGTVPATDAQ